MIWWTKSWNPVIGCSKCSTACENCYAEALHTQRHKALLAGKKMPPCYAEPFDRVRFFPERLIEPLHWRKPQMIFVCNMGDLFHDAVMDSSFLDRIFAVMAMCPQHTFMLLTKRSDNQLKYITSEADTEHMAWLADKSLGEDELAAHAPTWPLPNVWIGATIWDQASADRAVPILLSTPAAKRFVSVEPMLGPVDLGQWFERIDHCGACGAESPAQVEDVCPECGSDAGLITTWGCAQAERYRTGERYSESPAGEEDLKGQPLDWIICGGETGPGARPMHPDWPRKLRDDCVAAGVPFFFKQWGEYSQRGGTGIVEAHGSGAPNVAWPDGTVRWGKSEDRGGEGVRLARVGKAKAGRVLDGQEWSEVPRG